MSDINPNPIISVAEMDPNIPESEYEYIYPVGYSIGMRGMGGIYQKFFAKHGYVPRSDGEKEIRVRLKAK